MTRPDDLCGCMVTMPDGAALDAWNASVRGFLAHGAATADRLAETIRDAPDFALAQATRGLFCLLLGRAELVETARDALAAAREAALRDPPTEREAAYLDALADWLDGRPSAAIQRLEASLARHPRDALAMKLVHSIQFMLGRPAAMRCSIECLLPAWEGHPALGYLHGCHAFTLEETGAYPQAETAGALALALAPDDAWGLHAVAHVHDMTARARAGLAWLTPRRQAWSHCNNFRFHVWWHMALMHLDLGEGDAALALYDAEIRHDRTDDYRDIANATSLLSRLEIEGVDVGHRWDELADLAERRSGDGCLVFADLHYLLALIGGDRDAAVATLMGRMGDDAVRSAAEMDAVALHPGLAAAAGLAALGQGDYETAYARLSAARPDLISIGGSHAQRDIFERLTIEAALRAGRFTAADRLLAERTRRRGAEDGYTARRRALLRTRGGQASTA